MRLQHFRVFGSIIFRRKEHLFRQTKCMASSCLMENLRMRLMKIFGFVLSVGVFFGRWFSIGYFFAC